VKYLENLANSGKSYQKTNLTGHPNPQIFIDRMRDFLDRLGNPEKGFKVVHITGTAGKGSVSSMVHATLVKQGKKSGLFTSPFVVSTTEKIQVQDKYIDHKSFARFTDYLKPHIEEITRKGKYGVPSYFEIILAIAFLYFKQKKCEYVVLEVGLGGRFDATNIIKNSLVTAITNIGLDHTNVLGKTKSKIASDKAGIIKKGSKFFTTEEDKRLLLIFKKECEKVDAQFCGLDVQNLGYSDRNKLLAGSICKFLGVIKNTKEILETFLPARFEIVEKKPYVIIDCAHNPLKLASVLVNLKKINYQKLVTVIAISADKNWKSVLKIILPKINELFVTKFSASGRKCADEKELFDFAKKHIYKSAKIYLEPNPLQAFSEARKSLTNRDILLITGSFYLAGNIRSLYCPEYKILKQKNSRI